MNKKIQKFFRVYIWFVLPILGTIAALEDFYPDSIPFTMDIWMGMIVFVVIISMIVTFYSSFKGLFKHLFSGSKRNKILETGRPAKAKVLNIKESGEGVVTINEQPFVTLELEIDDGSSVYKTELKTVIARLDIPKFQPGKVFAVKVDPNDKMKVAFDPTGEIFEKETDK